MPSQPEFVFTSQSPVLTALFDPFAPTMILGGTYSGQIALWDERAMLEALEQRRIAGAGTDVFEEEPTAKDNPLFRCRNFVCTPHMAAHTEEAMRRMSLVAEDIVAVLQGREPRWPANRPKGRG